MQSKESILQTIGRPNNKARQIVAFHSTSDIIKQMQAAHYENSQFAKSIASRFKGSSVQQTCKNVFNFIKKNIRYRVEPADMQTTKSLQRLISDGYGDCKHYSGLFAAILTDNGIRNHYRFASYGSTKTPTHVYVVAYDENNDPIICDAVLPTFGDEKSYNYKIDKTMLMHLSGIGELDGIGKRSAAQKKAAKTKRVAKRKATVARVKAKVKKVGAKVKAAGKKIKAAAKKVGKGLKKVGLAAGRGAFLTLVSMNVRSLGTNVWKSILKNPNAVKSKWENLGGSFSKLKSAANNGKNKKRLGSVEEIPQIGSFAALTAALTAAAPVLVAIIPLIKSLVGNKAADESGMANVAAEASAAFEAATGKKVEETAFSAQADPGVSPGKNSDTTQTGRRAGGRSSDSYSEGAADSITDSPAESGSGSGLMAGNSKYLLIGGAALAAVLFLRK